METGNVRERKRDRQTDGQREGDGEICHREIGGRWINCVCVCVCV
jgi:hypothetical protein